MMKTEETKAAPTVLLQLTDPHLHANAASRMRGVNTYDSFVAVLAQAQRDHHWPPDAIIATGDLVQDESREGYERFRSCLDRLGVPVFCIPGNHDDPELMAEVLAGPPFQVCGDAALGAWRLIFLSTYIKGDDAGAVGEAGLAELDRKLSAYPSEPTLICMHHQPVPMGSAWLDGVGLKDAADFLVVADRHKQLRGIVWGHVHQALDRHRGDVRLLSAPSTCAQFLPKNDVFALDSLPPGCRWISLHQDGRIETSLDWLQPQR
jgi:Icc protein